MVELKVPINCGTTTCDKCEKLGKRVWKHSKDYCWQFGYWLDGTPSIRINQCLEKEIK